MCSSSFNSTTRILQQLSSLTQITKHSFFIQEIINMSFLLSLLLFSLFNSRLINGQGPPSPGYYPSSRVQSLGFNQCFRNLWGPQHQSLDQSTLTIWLDKNSGFTSCLSSFRIAFNVPL